MPGNCNIHITKLAMLLWRLTVLLSVQVNETVYIVCGNLNH